MPTCYLIRCAKSIDIAYLDIQILEVRSDFTSSLPTFNPCPRDSILSREAAHITTLPYRARSHRTGRPQSPSMRSVRTEPVWQTGHRPCALIHAPTKTHTLPTGSSFIVDFRSRPRPSNCSAAGSRLGWHHYVGGTGDHAVALPEMQFHREGKDEAHILQRRAARG